MECVHCGRKINKVYITRAEGIFCSEKCYSLFLKNKKYEKHEEMSGW